VKPRDPDASVRVTLRRALSRAVQEIFAAWYFALCRAYGSRFIW